MRIRVDNANIITMLDPEARAKSVMIDDDRIVAVDESQTADVVWDLSGRTVVPGFVDSHTHFHFWARTLDHLDMEPPQSLQEALALVQQRTREIPAGKWILGRGLNKNRWNPPDFPTCHDLDSVAPDHPVAIFSKDEHSLWVNSAALRASGVDRNTPDPPKGRIGRDESGELTGMLFETADELIMSKVPEPAPADTLSALSTAAALVLPLGVTSVHDVGMWEAWEAYRLWEYPPLDVVKYFPVETAEEVVRLGLKSGDGSPGLRIGGLKIFSDGALGSQTAYMWEPYEGSSDAGVVRITAAELREYLDFASAHRLACAVHAIGDRANSLVIDAAQAYPAELLRHRVEHVQLVREADIERLAASRWIGSVQPSHLVSDRDTAVNYWGEKRCRYAYAFESMRQAGVPLAFGTDVPIEPMNPIYGIHAACCRKAPGDERGPWVAEECMGRYDALYASTVGPAYAAGQEREVGQIVPGQRANLVVLDKDILAVPDDEILSVQVVATLVGGKPVYVNADAAPELAETIGASAV